MTDNLSPNDFAAWRDAALPAVPVVLDVREAWELKIATVTAEGFTLLHIPMQSLPARLAQIKAEYGAAHSMPVPPRYS